MSNRILLIDFDARTLAKWREVLGGSGYDVICAKNAAQATEHLEAHLRPGLVILEPMMPGLDGFTLCRTLKSQRTNRPPAVVIASRIYRGQKYRGFARDAGADLFIEKPIGDTDLLEIVARWVDPDTMIQNKTASPADAPAATGPIAAPEPIVAPETHASPAPAASPRVTAPMESVKPAASSNRTIPIQTIRPAPPADVSGPPTAPVGLDAGPETGIDLGAMSDDDIDDALSRLSLDGFGDDEPEVAATPQQAVAPLSPAASGTASDSGSFSADDLAQALDRLELTNDDDAHAAPHGEDADTAMIDVPDEDDEPSAGARLARQTGEKAHAAPPGIDDPPFFARAQPGRPGEGSAPPSGGLVSLGRDDPAPDVAARIAQRVDDSLTLSGLAGASVDPDEDDPPTRGASQLPPPHDENDAVRDLRTGERQAMSRAGAGRSSEGGDEARSSLPLPPWRDPDVSLSREFAPPSAKPVRAPRPDPPPTGPVEAGGPVVDPVAPPSAATIDEPERFAAPRGDTGRVDLVSAIDDVLRLAPRHDACSESGVSGPGESLARTDDAPRAGDVTPTPASADPARGDVAPRSPEATGPLRGMDPQTAELLSTLEELEDSLPPEIAGAADGASVLDGPPTREEELGLDELIERVTGRQDGEGAQAAPAPVTGAAAHDGPVIVDDASVVADDAPVVADDAPVVADELPIERDDAQAEADRSLAAVDAYYEDLLASASQRRTGLWIGVLVAIVVIGGAIIGVSLFRGNAGGYATTGVDGTTERATAPPVLPEATGSAGLDAQPGLRAVPDDAAGPGARGEAGQTERPDAPPAGMTTTRPLETPTGSIGADAAAAPRVERPAPAPARETTTVGGVRGSLPPAPEPLGRTAPRGGTPVVPLAEIDRPLSLLEYERPQLPEAARRAGARGRVFVQVLVGPEGTVLDTKAMMDPGHGLAEAARRSVRSWRYSRPSRDLEPVRVWKTEVVEFVDAD